MLRNNSKYYNEFLIKFSRNRDDHFVYYDLRNRKLIRQGWKIHVSSDLASFQNILDIVADFCFENNLAFKHLISEDLLIETLSKDFDQNESGKYITIYPRSEKEFVDVLPKLDILLRNFKGPYIFTDRQYNYNSNLYYRYGVIVENSRYLVTPTGEKIKDIEGPSFRVPPFVTDPFENEFQDVNDPIHLNKDVYIDEAIIINNWGGVYKGHLNNGKIVVVKQARPYVGTSSERSAIYLLQKEKNY